MDNAKGPIMKEITEAHRRFGGGCCGDILHSVQDPQNAPPGEGEKINKFNESREASTLVSHDITRGRHGQTRPSSRTVHTSTVTKGQSRQHHRAETVIQAKPPKEEDGASTGTRVGRAPFPCSPLMRDSVTDEGMKTPSHMNELCLGEVHAPLLPQGGIPCTS